MRRRRRAPNPHAPTNAVEVYPTRKGRSMRGTEPPVNEYAPAASEQDTEAGRCFQCGSPITNVNARTTCPFCDSDNFKGQRAI